MKTDMKTIMSLIIFQLIAVLLFGSTVSAQQTQGAAIEGPDAAQTENVSGNTYEENRKRWQSLSEQERQAIRERAGRLSPGQIQQLRKASERFKGMPREEQDKIRGNYQKFNRLPPREREVLRERYKRFESLPPENREELRRKFRERRDMQPGGPGSDPRMSGALPMRGPEPRRERESLPVRPGLNRPSDGPPPMPGREGSPNFTEDTTDRKDIPERRNDIQRQREDIRNRLEDRRDRGPAPDRQGWQGRGADPGREPVMNDNSPPVPRGIPGAGPENRPGPEEGPERMPDQRPEFKKSAPQGRGGGSGSGGTPPGRSPRDRNRR